MANLGDLLGSFMQSTLSKSGNGRIGNVLQDLQSGLGNLTRGLGSQGGSGGVLDKVLEMAKTGLGSAAQNPAQAAGIGAVLGSVLGGGGKSVSGAIKGGALAMLAGVAYQAITNAARGAKGAAAAGESPQFSGGDVPLGMRAPQTPAEEQAINHAAELVIKGMMNVAKSDGQVSADEIQRIIGKLREAGMEGDAEAWILAELRKPLDLDAFVAEIPNQEVAAQVYAASLLAVEVDTPQEKSYLTDFAKKTGIEGAVAQGVQKTLGVTV
jgi:uncharacterized membrane protein YebE (DUF533 family)